MSARHRAKDQPLHFEFTPDNIVKIEKIIAKYPKGRQQSAVLPLLDLAQRQNNNWLPEAAMRKVADILSMPYIRVYEVASFYTMFNLAPVGKYFIQVCRTTPCWLKGSDNITQVCKNKLSVPMGEITHDDLFSYIEVECLGACVNAPVIQINDDYYEDLDVSDMEKIIADLKAGNEIKVGSQKGRQASAPEGFEVKKKRRAANASG